jgi:hypothetical protein
MRHRRPDPLSRAGTPRMAPNTPLAGPVRGRPWKRRRCAPTIPTMRTDRPNSTDARPLYVRGQRNMTVYSATHRHTVRQRKMAPLAEKSQLRGHFRRWWQVLGSNQRRLSRRFYRPRIIRGGRPRRSRRPRGGSSATSGFPSPPANSLLSWTACSNDDHSGRSHRAKIRTPRSPRGQHGSSTRSGNDGHQPGTTGITLGHPARPGRPADRSARPTRHQGDTR